MSLKRGIPVSNGCCIGKALVLDAEEIRVPRRHVPETMLAHEQQLALRAFESACQEIAEERVHLRSRVGGDVVADILSAHETILKDPKLRQEILDLIHDKHYSAGSAIELMMRRFQRRFEAEPFLHERVRDVVDIKRRLLRHVVGEARQELSELTESVIVVSHDLTPSQTAALVRTNKVLGFATDLGGATSHTAIVARGLGIPAVVGLDNISSLVTPGDMLVLDGTHGVVIVDPDDAQLEEYREQEQRRVELIRSLEELRELPSQTRDGTPIELLGNIEFPEEVVPCIEKGATGIGLFRTEFLFMRQGPEPTEEDQFQVYRQVAERLDGKPLVIRTLDLGADKYVHTRAWEPEANPFLGLRSIRYCLRHREVFWPQLRAILRASRHGNVRIMFPMVSRVMELRQSIYLLRLAQEELEEEGFEIRSDIPIGVMIETPSAALCARELAREVQFLSIGTNDLIQYALAVDRTNERVASLYTPHDPSIIRLLREVVKRARQRRADVSLCGEMAGDALSTLLLVGLGLRRLSMSAGKIPEIKKIIRSIELADAEKVAQRVLRLESEREIVNYLRDETRRIIPELV